jgi:hypothetical protein
MWKHGRKNYSIERMAAMKFTVNNGKVPYIMVAGQDHVTGEMLLENVQKLMDTGTKRASNRFTGYPICVDNKYFFAGTSEKAKTKTTED